MKLKKVLEENYKILGIIVLLAAVLLTILIPILKNNAPIPAVGYSITDSSIMSVEHLPTGSTLQLEVASTPQKRESGLMFRDSLEKDSGMIFIFPSEMDLSFWMKNTSISLDMIFLNKDLKVTTIFSDTKTMQTTEIYNSNTGSQFAIETPAGWVLSHSIKVGDLFKIASVK